MTVVIEECIVEISDSIVEIKIVGGKATNRRACDSLAGVSLLSVLIFTGCTPQIIVEAGQVPAGIIRRAR